MRQPLGNERRTFAIVAAVQKARIVRIGAPISDFSTGLSGLAGVLAALFARDRFPEGQHIQVAMLDASQASATLEGATLLLNTGPTGACLVPRAAWSPVGQSQ